MVSQLPSGLDVVRKSVMRRKMDGLLAIGYWLLGSAARDLLGIPPHAGQILRFAQDEEST